MEPSHTVVCLSDLHCGSSRALCPPDFTRFDGTNIRHNAEMKWVWERWLEFQSEIIDTLQTGFTLILNGDLVEGVHHHTRELISHEPGDHVACALEALAPIVAKAGPVYVVTGTEGHTQNSEHSIARAISAQKNGNVSAFDRLDLVTNGTPWRAVHHMPTSGRISLYATQLSVQLAEAQMQAVRVNKVPPRFVVAAHRHTVGYYTDFRAGMVSLPPWQLLTRYGYKVVPTAEPCVGGAVLRFVRDGQLPEVEVWRRDAM